MATTKTFLDFNQKTSLSEGDYIVGYNAEGTAEYKTTLEDLAEYIKTYIQTNNSSPTISPTPTPTPTVTPTTTQPNNNQESSIFLPRINSFNTQWTQDGNTLFGVGGDYMGWSVDLCKTGTVFAVGSPSGVNTTHNVKVYSKTNNSWIQKGSTIQHEKFTGGSVSLNNDGTILAVGSSGVNVYKWNDTSSEWDIYGPNLNQLFPNNSTISTFMRSYKVSLNDEGNMLAVGKLEQQDTAGQVVVYKLTNGSWIQQGTALIGGAADQFGYSLQLNGTGDTLIIGASQEYDTGDQKKGYVEVYNWSGTQWNLKGTRITGPISSSQYGGMPPAFGYSVAINEQGNKILVGSVQSSCQAYIFNNGDWTPFGSSIDFSGYGVSMNASGNIIAVGNYPSNRRVTVVYYHDGQDWKQIHSEISGYLTPALNGVGDLIVIGNEMYLDTGTAAIFKLPQI